MSSEKQTVDNPTTEQSNVDDAVFGSTTGFFEDLDREVNGAIQEGEEPQKEEKSEEPSEETPMFKELNDVDSEEDNTDWKKRYSDSSREAQKIRQELDEMSRFKPFVEALQNDEGLVSTIRDYVQNGTKPKELKEEFNLPEDFIFDSDEAFSNPDSDSAKVFNSMISRAVNNQVETKLSAQEKTIQEKTAKAEQEREAIEFKKKMNVSDNDFETLMNWADEHKISFEDIYFLKNKDAFMSNVAKNTKSDMLEQMKAVRSIPTSAGATNSRSKATDPNDAVFDALKGLDNQVDSLFE
tara:strand:+ start:3170 stop:4057 length:888 start_codon:yes stop_codon:yes gene_type:complete